MSLSDRCSERLFGPIHFTTRKSSAFVSHAFDDAEVRVQGSDRYVYLWRGYGRGNYWRSLSVEQARQLAQELMTAADVAEGLQVASAAKTTKNGRV